MAVVTCSSDYVTMHYDNMVSLGYDKNFKSHRWTKYVDICYNFIRDFGVKGSNLVVHSYESLASGLIDETY